MICKGKCAIECGTCRLQLRMGFDQQQQQLRTRYVGEHRVPDRARAQLQQPNRRAGSDAHAGCHTCTSPCFGIDHAA